MDLLGEEGFGFGWFGRVDVDGVEVPHLDGSILTGGEDELGLDGRSWGSIVDDDSPTDGDGSYGFGVTLADGETLPVSSSFDLLGGNERPDSSGTILGSTDEPFSSFRSIEAENHVGVAGKESSVEG